MQKKKCKTQSHDPDHRLNMLTHVNSFMYIFYFILFFNFIIQYLVVVLVRLCFFFFYKVIMVLLPGSQVW